MSGFSDVVAIVWLWEPAVATMVGNGVHKHSRIYRTLVTVSGAILLLAAATVCDAYANFQAFPKSRAIFFGASILIMFSLCVINGITRYHAGWNVFASILVLLSIGLLLFALVSYRGAAEVAAARIGSEKNYPTKEGLEISQKRPSMSERFESQDSIDRVLTRCEEKGIGTIAVVHFSYSDYSNRTDIPEEYIRSKVEEQFKERITNSDRWASIELVERNEEYIQQSLKELNMSRSDLFDRNKIVKFGRMIGAQSLLLGRIDGVVAAENRTSITVYMEVLVTETGVILLAVNQSFTFGEEAEVSVAGNSLQEPAESDGKNQIHKKVYRVLAVVSAASLLLSAGIVCDACKDFQAFSNRRAISLGIAIVILLALCAINSFPKYTIWLNISAFALLLVSMGLPYIALRFYRNAKLAEG